VEEAAAAGELAEAEAPLALPTLSANDEGLGGGTAVSERVQFVGSKTFVWRDGVWMDTAYDPDVYTVTPVNFASDGYFELVTAVPELADYLAIGPRVLVVHEDRAYEIVESGGQESVPLVVTITVEDGSQPLPTNEPTTTPTPELQVTRSGNIIAFSTRVPETAGEATNSVSSWGIVGGILLALIALGIGIQIGRKSSG
jgi:hypothetical protein